MLDVLHSITTFFFALKVEKRGGEEGERSRGGVPLLPLSRFDRRSMEIGTRDYYENDRFLNREGTRRVRGERK